IRCFSWSPGFSLAGRVLLVCAACVLRRLFSASYSTSRFPIHVRDEPMNPNASPTTNNRQLKTSLTTSLRWRPDLRAAIPTGPDWLWQGYLARGMTTLLPSQWKSGKTTLISILLARMAQGGTLAGLSVKRAKAIVLSEESPQLLAQRAHRLDIDDHVGWLCR